MPDALADALGMVVAEQRREWRLEHDKEMAELRALLADTRRENAELRAELRDTVGAWMGTAKAEMKQLMGDGHAWITERLGSIRDGEPGPAGADGKDGRDADPAEIAALREEIRGLAGQAEGTRQALSELAVVSRQLEERASEPVIGPPGPPGESIPGQPGVGIASVERDGDRLIVVLDDERQFDLGPLPAGPQGPPGVGIQGEPGIGVPGPPGEKGAAGEKGDPGESIKGEPGENGEPGVGIAALERDGNRLFLILDDERRFDVGELPRGEKGDPGAAGRDGVSFVDGFVDRSGSLILTRDDGTTREIRGVAGRDGADGAPGRDGLGFDDIAVEYNGQRQFSIWFSRGSVSKHFDFEIPVALYRGIHKEGENYGPGDLVTKGGSLWHCDAPEPGVPAEGNNKWTLAAKRGRDGRDGKDGERGPPGPPGKSQPELAPMGPIGSK